MRVKITNIHPADAYYGSHDRIIGQTGTLKISTDWGDGQAAGDFYPDTPILGSVSLSFYRVKYEEIENEEIENVEVSE